jgi:transcriptional regulator with XRE-family HTH domain
VTTIGYSGDMDAGASLSENLRFLRTARGLSQERAAALAGIPRPTWATLESGSANPTLTVLLRVAAALQVRIEELIASPRPDGRRYPASALPLRRRGEATIRDLLPEKLPCAEIGRLDLPAGAVFTGVPHAPGTREYLACESGRLTLVAGGQTLELDAGDVAVFRGDQRHSYRNPGRVRAVGYSVVLLAGPAP